MALQEDHNQVETSLVSNGPPKQKQGGGCQKIFIILLLTIILILIIVIVTGETSEPSVSPGKIHACTSGWKAYEQKCYYFSEEEKNWTLSQSFCASQNASLAVFESKEEMRVMMCLKGNFPFWIGVSREPGQLWKWLHGYSSALEVSGDGGNCAYLNDEPKPSSSRCSSEHHFICTQSMEQTGAVAVSSKRSVHVEVCPHDWITYRKKCYYFSEKEGDWNSSNEFCLSHNASLARIEDDEETFCRILDMKRSYWIGIQQETGEMWKWLNGDIAKMKVIGGGDCAFWTAKESNARASRCTSGHYWFCSKSATSTNHKEI